MKKSIGYITRHEINNWNIPQKVQTAAIQYFANLKKKQLSYIVTEYLDSKNNALLIYNLKHDKKIENIFFLSVFQLKLNISNFSILNKVNLYFYLENIFISKSRSLNNLAEYLKKTKNIKKVNFNRKNYLDIFKNYENFFS
jgi:sporadic carbohydrate cluster protein (TIGR04323 family)